MTDAAHVPVLKEEVLGILEPRPGKRIVDGTFGFGGHALALLEAGAEVLGLDLDDEAVATCRRISADRLALHCLNQSYRRLPQALAQVGWQRVDGLLLDLGVNSQQLDDPGKGFSYRADGPVDLRFDRHAGRSAADLLANVGETELADLLWRYGEERNSRRIARAIVAARREEPVATTTRLVEIVAAALPPKMPPAARPAVLSRVFQALRIVVNDELGALAEVLDQVPACLRGGGRVVVIAYHSLEDRIVKQWIDRERRDCICPPELPQCCCTHRRTLVRLTKRVVKPSAAEVATNPRSRSARLRGVARVDG